MQLKAKLVGDFSCKSVNFYDTGVRMFNAVLDVRMTETEVAAVFGDGLAGVAFSGLATDEDGEVSWGYKRTTPDSKCPAHHLQLYTKSADGPQKLGPKLGVMPKVTALKPAPDEAKVIVSIEFPIEVKDAKLGGALVMAMGSMVVAEVEPAPVPKQDKLPGMGEQPTAPVATPTGPHGNVVVMPGAN